MNTCRPKRILEINNEHCLGKKKASYIWQGIEIFSIEEGWESDWRSEKIGLAAKTKGSTKYKKKKPFI